MEEKLDDLKVDRFGCYRKNVSLPNETNKGRHIYGLFFNMMPRPML